MTHRQAVWLMVAVALMWSIAGVVTRWLESARGFEITFLRSACTALALALILSVLRGPAALSRSVRHGGSALWIAGGCWAVMFTAFMLALTLTTVANVLITMALAPLFTAIVARVFLHYRVARRTWGAIVVAGVGIAWMYGREVSGAGAQHVLGTVVALGVPIAAAVNWTLMQHLQQGKTRAGADLLPAVLVGALISAALTLPFALPFQASLHDLGLLALLGLVQLAIPCLLSVVAARVLSAPEISLLALLEVVFGVLWAWLGAGETPSLAVLGGGSLVLAALVGNALPGLKVRSD